MRRFPPPGEPPERRPRREQPRPERPFDRLLRRKPERDPAPIIIGGTIAFLAFVIIMVFAFSSVLGDDDGGGGGDSSNGTVPIAEGVDGRLAPIPALPPGLVALSEFIEFEADDPDVSAAIGLPLTEDVEDATGVAFYTYIETRWQRTADARLIDTEVGQVAEGDFATVPENVAVLRVVAQTYQVAGSLPANTTLHPDARVNIINPRDFTPGADGSIQGTPTTLAAPEGVLVMPTVVGSGADTGATVDDILADETLRNTHAQAIFAAVQASGYAGIDLEYAIVNPDLSSQFTDFVDKLSEQLHNDGRKLSLTLPPATNQRQAYDWPALGGAADYIRILPIADPVAYWETMPGAIGRLIEDVPREKVMLVVSPFSVESSSGVSRPIGYLQAMVQAAEAAVREPQNPTEIKPGVTVNMVAVNLDQSEGAQPLRWADDAAAVTYSVGGTEPRRVYIENTYSVSFKLEIVQAYGLGGVSVSDASAQSDVANIWPVINELSQTATVALRKPNDTALLPTWQAPDGGDLGAGAGTSAIWVAPGAGQYNIVLIVSDAERRFGRNTPVTVNAGDQTSPTPLETFPPETDEPTATPLADTPTPTPSGGARIELFVSVDGDGDGEPTTDVEEAQPGSEVTYFVTIDNDSEVPMTVSSLTSDVYGDVSCDDVVGLTLDANDGDGEVGFNGGSDQVTCTFTVTAPDPFDAPLDNVMTVFGQDDDGGTDSDSDNAAITPATEETPTE